MQQFAATGGIWLDFLQDLFVELNPAAHGVKLGLFNRDLLHDGRVDAFALGGGAGVAWLLAGAFDTADVAAVAAVRGVS